MEDFPLRKERDSRRCRIFGHDCPVFYVAEPITETKQLRRISRAISRPVQFRVMKRDNQICSACGSNVQDADAHFDHVIPYSKGGSSDESNVRLLCEVCNQKRSNRFEHEHLVQSFVEHTQVQYDLSFLRFLRMMFKFAHAFREQHGHYPDAAEVGNEFASGKTTAFEEGIAQTIQDFLDFFSTRRPEELTARQMQALRVRWGFSDGVLHPIAEVSHRFREDVREMVIRERALLARAGWYVKEDKFTRRSWEKT